MPPHSPYVVLGGLAPQKTYPRLWIGGVVKFVPMATVFAKHLPPSAGLPRVLALDAASAQALAGLAHVTRAHDPAALPAGPFDAIAGPAAPEQVDALGQRLRPGGRLILTHTASPEALLTVLTGAGLIHCLVEPLGPLSLYRGERPPAGTSFERMQALAAEDGSAPLAPDKPLPITPLSALKSVYVFLLVTQTPNKPAWKLEPGEPVTWRAATVLPAASQPPMLLAFTSLVKAVACMQGAVRAGRLTEVNKVSKFPVAAAEAWALPLTVNPTFDAIRDLAPGPALPVDPLTAITGDE